MSVLPNSAERSSGGFFSASAVHYAAISIGRNFETTPEVGAFETYRSARGLVADAAGTVTVIPPGGTASVVIPVAAGVPLPVYFVELVGVSGPASVIALF